MELKVRNIDANIVKKLEALAEENNLSREEFIRKSLDEVAYKKEALELNKRYDSLMESLKEIVIIHTKVMGLFIDEFLIDPDEAFNYDLEQFFEQYNSKDIEEDIHSLTNISKHLSESKINLNYNLNDYNEIRIRNISSDVSERIKEISEKQDISQNEFLNNYMKQITYSETLQLIDNNYNYMIEKTLGLLHLTDRVLTIFKEENIIDWEE